VSDHNADYRVPLDTPYLEFPFSPRETSPDERALDERIAAESEGRANGGR